MLWSVDVVDAVVEVVDDVIVELVVVDVDVVVEVVVVEVVVVEVVVEVVVVEVVVDVVVEVGPFCCNPAGFPPPTVCSLSPSSGPMNALKPHFTSHPLTSFPPVLVPPS